MGTTHPDSKSIWDYFMGIIMLWVCVMSPYIICFGGPVTVITVILTS